MSVVLSPAEQKTVDEKRKSDSSLPSYFDSGLRQDVKISRDFESFLILSTGELKTTAIKWIDKAVTLNKANAQRDALYKLAAAQERLNAEAQIAIYNQQLDNFDKFRQNFQKNAQFADVAEVSKFLQDLQKVIDERVVGLDRAKFDHNISLLADQALSQFAVQSQDIEELQSWNAVLSAYLS